MSEPVPVPVPVPGRGRRVLGVVGLGVLATLLFWVPSAYAIHRGLPRWAALIAAVFPLGLVGWHLLAERRRRRAGGKGTLTGSDRFVMRLIAVALIAIVPLVALDRGGTWQAIKRHGAWWLDWSDPPAPRSPVRDARVLDVVPADAEGLIWSAGSSFFAEVIVGAAEADGPVPEEALVAVAPGRVVLAIRGEAARLDRWTSEDFVPVARARGVEQTTPLTLRRPAPDLLVVISDDWIEAVDARLAGGGRRTPLAARLRGPAGAIGVAVWRPPASGMDLPITEVRGWMTAGDGADVIEATVQTTSVDTGEALRRGGRDMLDRAPAALSGECAEHARALVAAVKIGGSGAEVRLAATLSHDHVRAIFGCIATAAFAR